MRRGREVELLLAHAIVLSIYYPSLMLTFAGLVPFLAFVRRISLLRYS